MRIYSRRNRNSIRYYLRCLRTSSSTEMDFWTLVMGLTMLFLVILWPAAVGAQDAGTVPPVSGITCSPTTGDIEGCDKLYLPEVAR